MAYIVQLVAISLLSNAIKCAENVCMWGITDSNGVRYNGAYLGVPGSPQQNGRDYWRLPRLDLGCAFDAYYVYWYLGAWRIGGDFNTVFASCNKGNSNHPQFCTEWQIGQNVDSGAQVTIGDCPSPDCGTITVDSSRGSSFHCTGETEQLSPYVYNTTDDAYGVNYIWFYNIPSSGWFCTQYSDFTDAGSQTKDAPYDCDLSELAINTNDYMQSSAGWQDMDSTTNTEIKFDAFNNQQTYEITMTCTSPGNTYTKEPTTPNPTRNEDVTTAKPTFAEVTHPGPTQSPVPTMTPPPVETPAPVETPSPTNDGSPADTTDVYEATPSPTDSTNKLSINFITILIMIAMSLSVLII